MGNGTGEWKVPVGGMGALVKELIRVATSAGVEILGNSKVTSVVSDESGVITKTESGDVYQSDYLLSNAAPAVLAKLRGKAQPPSLDGSQMKINILLKRLPELKSGIDPRLAFAGTFHANESFSQLEETYLDATEGVMPAKMPVEMYCHTLSDPSILAPDLQASGYQTLTLFGLHTPASLFDADNDAARDVALASALRSVNEYLAEPIEDVIAAIEVKTPLDIEEAIALPRGNIFHKDLSMPFREDGSEPSWGVETDDPRIFICGAGAIRGGGVSGIPGHNAAMAVLSKT
jgi:phytoene dehydrogenase-like protein